MVVYLLLYGPTARVAIEDAYTGAVRTVDNVPLGVAASGSLVSSVGYQLTRLFEQGFGTPKLTGEGFGSSLALLLNSRQATFGRANTLGGGDVERTLTEYLKDCTLIGMDLGFVREADLQNAADALAALRWDSRWYTTLTFLPGDPASGAERDCTDAYQALSQHLNSGAFRAAWEAHLTGLYGANPLRRAQDALDAIVGIGKDARTVMLNNVLAGMYLLGIRAKHLFEGDTAAALITESAIAQRNTQGAAERSLFLRLVRPMLAAIEGLMYAVTPLLAFLIALNGFGLRLLGQYLQMAFWIQLWLPILAIINLYINLVAQHEMAALANVQAIDPVSWLGLVQMQLSFADWLGTGSLLAASVPAIALFLVWGGSVTATNLASRMQAGDFIGEKNVAPDPLITGPLTQLEAGYTHNLTQGVVQTGAPGQLLPVFNREQVASASISSHQQEVQQASQRWLDTLARSAQASFSVQNGVSHGQTLSQSLSASHSAVDGYIHKAAQETVRSSGVENVSADQVAGAAMLSGSVKRLGATLESQYHTSQQDAQKLQDAFSHAVGGQENYQAEIANRLAQDARSGVSQEYARSHVAGPDPLPGYEQEHRQAEQAGAPEQAHEPAQSRRDSGR
ncbi:MAG: conjugal transfer protein TraG N-terminal domain-containing protein [Candidatus Competibacteraceae bacterium]